MFDEAVPEGAAPGGDAPDDAAPPSGVPRVPVLVVGVVASMPLLEAHPRPAAHATARYPPFSGGRDAADVADAADGLYDGLHEKPFGDCPRG